MMTVEQTLTDLVAIDSVSSRSNADLISYLEARCKTAGFITDQFPHVDPSGVTKINLVARRSTKPKIELALVGHTDTVPYDPPWPDALRLTENDRRLFRRAASDTNAS